MNTLTYLAERARHAPSEANYRAMTQAERCARLQCAYSPEPCPTDPEDDPMPKHKPRLFPLQTVLAAIILSVIVGLSLVGAWVG